MDSVDFLQNQLVKHFHNFFKLIISSGIPSYLYTIPIVFLSFFFNFQDHAGTKCSQKVQKMASLKSFLYLQKKTNKKQQKKKKKKKKKKKHRPSENLDQPACLRSLSEFSMCTFWKAKHAEFLRTDNEDSVQTARMRKMICLH